MRIGTYIIIIITLSLMILFTNYCWVNKEGFFQKKNIDPLIYELQAILLKVDPDVASKINIQDDTSSYTINKKNMHLCLRDEDGEYFNKNMLIYVAIHELAHCKCKSIGHTPEFYRIMDEMLEKAKKLGIYQDDVKTVRYYEKVCGEN